MPHWPHAILFDFDGVIVNSEPLHYLAFHEVLRAEKVDLTEQQYYQELIGFDDKGAFRRIFELNDRELDPKTFLRVMTRKSEVMMELIRSRKFEPLPGAEEFVRSLWRHCPLAIVSGALREEIEVMLEGIALRDCFTIITSAEDVEVGKPDPRGYVQTMKQLGEKSKRDLKPSGCLIVEDAASVIKRVKEKGFVTLGVAIHTTPEKLKDADAVVTSLKPDEVRKKLTALRWVM